MSYFKAPNGSLHYLEDDTFVHLLPPDSVGVSDAEAEQMRAAEAAAQAATEPTLTEPTDPVEKLKAFLTAHPDVAAIFK